MTITISYKPTLDSHYKIEDNKENYTKRRRLNTKQEFMYSNLSDKKSHADLSYNSEQSLWSNNSTTISLKDMNGSSKYPAEIHLNLVGISGLSNSEKREFLGILNSLTDREILPKITIKGGAGVLQVSDIEEIAQSIVKLQNKNPDRPVNLEIPKFFISKLNEQSEIPKPTWTFDGGKLAQKSS